MKRLLTSALIVSGISSFAQPAPCEKHILPYAVYKEATDQKWQLELKKQERTLLYYFGAEHSKDTSQQQFATMKNLWSRVKPTIALFEGPNRGTLLTANETISKLGESGYVRFLAKNDSIPVMTLDPPAELEINYLNTYFPAGQVKLFFCLREAQQVRDRNKWNKEEIDQHISQLLAKANQLSHMQDTLKTVTDIEIAYKHYWGYDREWWQAPADWFTPEKTSPETGSLFTNDINRRSSEFRNRYMYRLISKLLQEGKTVFAVVGRNHVPMQAPALICEWEKLQGPSKHNQLTPELKH